MQPAGAAATTASRPTAWLASPLAERHQRGAASNVERPTHEAASRGRRRGRGLVVLLRAAATVSAGARQAGSRDQCRQREPSVYTRLSRKGAWGVPLTLFVVLGMNLFTAIKAPAPLNLPSQRFEARELDGSCAATIGPSPGETSETLPTAVQR